jgi:hypothetical protein
LRAPGVPQIILETVQVRHKALHALVWALCSLLIRKHRLYIAIPRIRDSILHEIHEILLAGIIDSLLALLALPDVSRHSFKAGYAMRNFINIRHPCYIPVFPPFQLRLIKEVLMFLDALSLVDRQLPCLGRVTG